MSLVCRELTGITFALWHTLRNNRRVLIRTSKSLLRNYRYIGMLVLARINANGNINDASFERLHQWKLRAEQEPFAPNWFVSSGLALAWSTPVLDSVKGCWRVATPATFHRSLHRTNSVCPTFHQLLLPFTEAYIEPTPFAQIGQGYLGRDLCEGILLHIR